MSKTHIQPSLEKSKRKIERLYQKVTRQADPKAHIKFRWDATPDDAGGLWLTLKVFPERYEVYYSAACLRKILFDKAQQVIVENMARTEVMVIMGVGRRARSA